MYVLFSFYYHKCTSSHFQRHHLLSLQYQENPSNIWFWCNLCIGLHDWILLRTIKQGLYIVKISYITNDSPATSFAILYKFLKDNWQNNRQLRARRALMLSNEVPLRTRRAIYHCSKSMKLAPFWFIKQWHCCTALMTF